MDDNSLKSLAQVIDEASIFLEESVPEGDSEAEDEEKEEEEYYVHQLIKLRAVACYQLALSSFQLSKSLEGDNYLHKLGFTLRLADEVLKYNGNRPLHLPPPPTSLPPSHCIIDEALPSSLFSQLHESFAASDFWSAHGYPTDRFFSYNLPLSPPSFPSLLHQLSSTVRSLLLPSFPSLESASSAEIWAHSRTSDGHHQLHYDLDEVALARGEVRRGEERRGEERRGEERRGEQERSDNTLPKPLLFRSTLTLSIVTRPAPFSQLASSLAAFHRFVRLLYLLSYFLRRLRADLRRSFATRRLRKKTAVMGISAKGNRIGSLLSTALCCMPLSLGSQPLLCPPLPREG